jgi:hypothetical protein
MWEIRLHQEISAATAFGSTLVLQATKPWSVDREQEKEKQLENDDGCKPATGLSDSARCLKWLMVADGFCNNWSHSERTPSQNNPGTHNPVQKRSRRLSRMRMKTGRMARESRDEERGLLVRAVSLPQDSGHEIAERKGQICCSAVSFSIPLPFQKANSPAQRAFENVLIGAEEWQATFWRSES